MSDQILSAIRAAFLGAPTWGRANPTEGPPKSLDVTFRRPEDPASEHAKLRYYLPAGETLAHLARRAGCQNPSAAQLVLREDKDQTGPLVTVRVLLMESEAKGRDEES